MSWTCAEIAAITGGELKAEGAAVTTVSTDTRTLPAGALFVALRGPSFDGADFAPAAIERGAAAVLAERPVEVPEGVGLIVVGDSLRALGDLAQAHLQRLGVTSIAITGSNGKTGTKEMTAAVLRAYGEVTSTRGNFNNLVGLPLTAFSVKEADRFAVFEMGMNAPGEIARLTAITRPKVGVVVSIGEAHLEGVGSMPGVIRAKGELYAGLGDDAVAVVNTMDRAVVKAARGTAAKVLTVGTDPSSDVAVSRVQRQGIGGFTAALRIGGRSYQMALRALGEHEVWNAALAVGVAVALGLDPEPGLAALQRYTGAPGRLNWRVAGGINVIDDTYNANPASMRAALRTLTDLGAGSRCIAVLGDMLELGDKAAQLHRDVGLVAADVGVDVLYAVGRHSEDYATGFYGDKVMVAEQIGEIVEHLKQHVAAGDWVLVKGSRGMRMERIVAALCGEDA